MSSDQWYTGCTLITGSLQDRFYCTSVHGHVHGHVVHVVIYSKNQSFSWPSIMSIQWHQPQHTHTFPDDYSIEVSLHWTRLRNNETKPLMYYLLFHSDISWFVMIMLVVWCMWYLSMARTIAWWSVNKSATTHHNLHVPK